MPYKSIYALFTGYGFYFVYRKNTFFYVADFLFCVEYFLSKRFCFLVCIHVLYPTIREMYLTRICYLNLIPVGIELMEEDKKRSIFVGMF